MERDAHLDEFVMWGALSSTGGAFATLALPMMVHHGVAADRELGLAAQAYSHRPVPGASP